MGRSPTPEPPDITYGDDCPRCTDDIPLFLPGRTPANVHVTRYGFPGDPTTFTIPQVAPCEWEVVSPTSIVLWLAHQHITGWTMCRIHEMVGGVLTETFYFFGAPACQTNMPNQEIIDPRGDYVLITW